MHAGARIDGGDYFDDLFESGGGESQSVLSGMGLADFDNVREKVTAEGLQAQTNCRNCGRGAVVTIGWDELFYIGSNGPGLRPILPSGWGKSQANGTCYCQLRCGGCGEPGIALHLTPDEAQKRFGQGMQSGFVSPDQARIWQGAVKSHRGG